MNIIDRQGKINLNSTPVGYEFIHQGKDYQFPTLEKVHEFFFTETKLDTVKLCHQGKKSYVHFTLDEIETFSSKKALRRILSQESEGAWIEKRDGKKKYFVDNGWLFSSIKKVSKEEYQNRPEEGSTFQKVLGVALGLFAIAPAAVECARRMPVGTQEAAMGLIAMQHRSPLLAVLGYSLLPQLSRAQAVGMEFQVNNYVLSDQSAPNVAPLKDGGFLVTWRSYGQDGDGYGIYAKRYNANGIQIGLEFRVNSNTTNSQSDPCAASLNDGGFVIAWTSNGQDGDGSGIYAQRYDATSIRIGTEFRVNNCTTNNQYSPRVAPLEDGGFIIVWTSEYQDGDFTGVYGQRYNVSGLKNSAEFLVNTQTLNLQQDPSITALKNRKVIVTWTSYGQDGDSGGTYAQMYDASIVPNGTEFRVNTYTTGTQGYPSIAALMDGGFVITWLSFAQDGDGSGVFGQKYDFNRAQIGLEFQINNYTTNPQQKAQVAHFGNLGFVVTWMSYGQDGDLDGIFAQIFDIIGLKNGTEFQVNNYTTSEQSNPSIASLEYGGFVIIWQSQDQDGSGNGIFGQRFDANGTPIPLIIAPNNPTSNIPTPSFSASITSPSSANSQSSNPTPSITTIASPTSNTPTSSFSASITSPSSVNSQSSNPTPSITTIASPTSNTPTSSFSASITSPSSANSQSSNPTPSITVIASSILSTPSGASSAQIGSSTNINPQQTPTTAPPGSSQNPTPVIPSPISQFSPSINPVSLTPSPISSPTPPFPAPSVLLTYNPDSSSNPASSSEAKCDQDCLSSYANLIGGLLGGVASIVTIALGVFAIYKCKKNKAKEKEDIELQPQQNLAPEVQNLFGGYPKAQKYWNVVSPQEQALIKALATLLQHANPAISQPQANPNYAPLDLSVSSSSEEIVPQNPPINLDRKILGGDQYQYEYEIIPVITQREANQLLRQTGYRVHFGGQAQVQKIQLGSGHFGEVSIAQIRGEQRFLAVKEVQGEQNIKQSRKEGRYQRELTDGPNILPIYDSIVSEGKLYHFIQLAGFGDGKQLKDKIINLDSRLQKSILMKTALGICNGLLHMHGKNLYHFDLKPDNILFDQVGEVYISDFGHTQRERNGRTSPPYGDFTYASPEARTQYRNLQDHLPIQPVVAEKQDAWGIGMILVEMLGLFDGNRDDQFETTILETLNQANPQDGDLEYLILELLQPDPAHRWTVQNAHDYLTQNCVTIGDEARETIFDMLARIPEQEPVKELD